MPLTLDQLNAAPPAEAEQMLDGLFEHTPWIAQQALAQRPFQSLAHLKHVMTEVLGKADVEQQLALIRYYGWRIQILSVFPNITDIEATNSREEPFPWFNTIFLSVGTLLILFVVFFMRRRFKRKTRGEVLG